MFRKVPIANIRSHIFASATYWWMLSRSNPSSPQPLPVAFEGNPQRGQSFRLSDFVQKKGPADGSIMDIQNPSDRFLWLADLKASGLETSVSVAQEVVEDWIQRQTHWTANAWSLDVLADRVCSWISTSPFVLAGADPDFTHLFTRALASHANHLAFAVRLGEDLPLGFSVQKALIYCGCSLTDRQGYLDKGLKLLEQAIGEEILADGGHVSRNPFIYLLALRHLIEVRAVLQGQAKGDPIWLQAAIDKMAPMLRMFVLGDGRLANFNGAASSDPIGTGAVLKKSSASGRAVTNAPHSGFQRLVARRTVVVMDCGVTANTTDGTTESAGTHSFEMSTGKHRLIVNCGVASNETAAFKTALRGTAAHSTLSVENANSSEIHTTDGLGPRRAWQIQALRREIDKNTLVESTHDGYLGLFGLTHKRSLYLSADGNELRGEDVLEGPGERAATIRFHLHPAVQASLIESGDSILLKFGRATGWRFRSSVAKPSLEPSIYYEGAERRHSQQIILNLTHNAPKTVIKWRLSVED